MRFDAVALGELLIDFSPIGQSAQGDSRYEANPGGAVCNLLAALAGLGRRTAYIGKVGDDHFGRGLAASVSEVGIDISGLRYDAEIPTTLAFVQLDEKGDRSFSFYRNPGADIRLSAEEVDPAILRDTRLFHFGSLSMTAEPVRSATLYAIEQAKNAGARISFDPNLRPPLWQSAEHAKAEIRTGLGLCDVLKIADNELSFLTGLEDTEQALDALYAEFAIPLIFATMGAAGSACRYRGRTLYAPCDERIVPVNTTGAGDTFFGATLSCLLDSDWDALTDDELLYAMKFGNTAAGLITTRHGALRVMPAREEILSGMDY